MTPAFYVYRALHQRLLQLLPTEDDCPADEKEAMILRDYMDPLWCQMTEEERESPNQGKPHMTTTLYPTDDKVVILADKEAPVSKGGIHLPDSAKERPGRGKVVAVGQGRPLENGQRASMFLQPGDSVVFGKRSGLKLQIDDTEYLILTEGEVIAKVGA